MKMAKIYITKIDNRAITREELEKAFNDFKCESAYMSKFDSCEDYIDDQLMRGDLKEEEFNDYLVQHMDDDLREQVASELAPCSNEDFYNRYCELHLAKYGEEYELN
jgi:hypothetical protein